MKSTLILLYIFCCFSQSLIAQELSDSTNNTSKWEIQLGLSANVWVRTFHNIEGRRDLVDLKKGLDVTPALRVSLGYQLNKRIKTWLAVESGKQNVILKHSFTSLPVDGRIMSQLWSLDGPRFLQFQLGANAVIHENEKAQWYVGLGAGYQWQEYIDSHYEKQSFFLPEGIIDLHAYNNRGYRWVPQFRAHLGVKSQLNTRVQYFAEVFYSQSLSAIMDFTALGYIHSDPNESAQITFRTGYINPGFSAGGKISL